MAEYIDREIMIRLFQSFKVVNNLSPYDAVLVSDITDFINDVPTADIKPGENCNDCYFRKMLEGVEIAEVVHGRNLKEKYLSLFECSICGWEDWDTYTGESPTYNYCPNCGAKIDGESWERIGEE